MMLKRICVGIHGNFIFMAENKWFASRDSVEQVEEGNELAESLGVTFMETSAKTSENVEQAFLNHRYKVTPTQLLLLLFTHAWKVQYFSFYGFDFFFIVSEPGINIL